MRTIRTGLAALSVACLVAPALSNGFPERGQTMRLVVPFAAGGGVDAAARVLGTQLQKQTGLTVVVENKAGASGTIGGKAVQTATADGYTLLFSAATHVMARQVLSNPPYDPQVDFVPVARTGSAPLLLVASPSRKEASLQELLGTIRQQPERWTAGIPAAGAPSHLATLSLAKQAQLKFTLVPYKGTQPALMDVAGGHTDVMLDSAISLLPMAKTGRVRPIAISSAQRSAVAADIPTFREAGLANFVYDSWYGVWAPKGTPPDRVAALNAAINQATGELARSGALAKLGIDPVTESPEQFRRAIAAEVSEGSELLKQSGFKPE